MTKGTLYGIGVGPGSPDLLTLRAVEALGKVDVILAAASPANDYSSALAIARPFLPMSCRMERLDFPMTRDQAILAQAWLKAAATTLQILRAGENAAFLTIGDPLIYSTFAYLLANARHLEPDLSVVIVPGITSFQAAAAKSQISLCQGVEHLAIISGIAPEEELEKMLAQPGPAVILKAYRNFAAIHKALQATGRSKNAIAASHVEREEEKIIQGTETYMETRPPYMTLLISRQKDA